MRRADLGASLVGLVALAGCWAGGPLPDDQITHRHDAVVWVYRAGGQIGRWGLLPVRVTNDLLDLQPGDGCVHVREGQTGGQCSAAPQADLQLAHALDLKTGRSVSPNGPAGRVKHPKPVRREGRGHWEAPIGGGLSVYTGGETGRLHLRLPDDVLILEVQYADPQVTYRPWLGVPIAALRMPDDLLVLGLSIGYVVCVDLGKLPAASSALDGATQ